MSQHLPETQYAVQLVGPDELRLNTAKPVPRPAAQQLVCCVEAVGLCFSDLKLVKQFSSHPRKPEVTSGLDPAVLAEVSSYVPGDLPTVPGHEAVVRVAAVGEGVTCFRPGERYLVQTDYRWLRTAAANAAFGYNLEGALQEYVLLDERVITSPEGESMLIPVPETFSASAIALVEPWACVEDAYASVQRQALKADGRMLVVTEAALPQQTLKPFFARFGQPAQVMHAARAALADLPDGGFDDVLYTGASAEAVEALFPKLAPNGLLVIALCGGRLARAVAAPVGAVHYRNLRVVGTPGSDPAEAMTAIPASGEIRAGDRINVIGAGGPMGVMHVVRCLCRGVEGISLYASDLDEGRLTAPPDTTQVTLPDDGSGKAAAALGWLNVNCGSCHNANPTSGAFFTNLYFLLKPSQVLMAGGASLPDLSLDACRSLIDPRLQVVAPLSVAVRQPQLTRARLTRPRVPQWVSGREQ